MWDVLELSFFSLATQLMSVLGSLDTVSSLTNISNQCLVVEMAAPFYHGMVIPIIQMSLSHMHLFWELLILCVLPIRLQTLYVLFQ